MDVSLIGDFLDALRAVHGGVPIFVMMTMGLGVAALIILGLWRSMAAKEKIIHELYGTLAQDLRDMQDETAALNGKLIEIVVRIGERRP